ncbi:MAG TPA: helix-turn-helix domain-containing protein [Methylomirabilota bacterium]|nr:helix-turn-helix domain-containing protein [Methylomirabilota bacterium]
MTPQQIVDDQALTGPRLVEMRKRRGWSQRKLALELSVTVPTISRWECGRVPISAAMSKLIRATLG